jgi:hypothetical protein
MPHQQHVLCVAACKAAAGSLDTPTRHSNSSSILAALLNSLLLRLLALLGAAVGVLCPLQVGACFWSYSKDTAEEKLQQLQEEAQAESG